MKLGWEQRCFFPFSFFYLPSPLWEVLGGSYALEKWAKSIFLLILTFSVAVYTRFLELPYWESSAFLSQGEYLLATHDAYHWIAGAEGFEFGTGHPMSELARIVADFCSTTPARAGFWLPAVLSGFFAVSVYLWGAAFNAPFSGFCAGVLASLSPAFFARTLLGFYDTDLVILTFAVLLGLIPAVWLSPWLISPAELIATYFRRKKHLAEYDAGALRYVDMVFRHILISVFIRWVGVLKADKSVCALNQENIRPTVLAGALSPLLFLWLILSGWFGFWMQDWHSLFPYLVRFLAVAIPLLILVLGPCGGRDILLHGALCHVYPLLMGGGGAFLAIFYAIFLWKHILPVEKRNLNVLEGEQNNITELWNQPAWLCFAWGGVAFLICDVAVLTNMLASFWSYVDRSGDVFSHGAAGVNPAVFPSVSQSIIEVQQVKFSDVVNYLYPEEFIVWCAFFSFCLMFFLLPAFIWFFPFMALSFLSLKMGGRMSMFGAPALFLPLCMLFGLFLEQAFVRIICFVSMTRQGMRQQNVFRTLSIRVYTLAGQAAPILAIIKFFCSLYCAFLLNWPLVKFIPELTQGPIISAQQAEGLRFIKKFTPPESVVWNWWDWGYATHHFAKRKTIADGARHGGPALYLPAAVYTTSDPRFARQLIKYTAEKEHIPGNVFTGLSAEEAQTLMTRLQDKNTPLIENGSKQYLVVSFELMRLGVWVTKYGSWNFISKSGPGALMNNVFQPLDFNMDLGTVVAKNGGQAVLAGSIDIFEPKGVVHKAYPHKGGYHFIFNLEDKDRAEIMIMDTAYYSSLMVQLMLASPDDPRFAPYFKLVFDNVYTRVYEVK